MSSFADRPPDHPVGHTDDELVSLLRGLVEIDSSNPDLGRSGAGETAIADFVTAWLEPSGCEIVRFEETPGRPSVVATWRGSGGGRSLMLNGHLDTVSLDSYEGDGLASTIVDGRLYGRGSYDMKSGLAAMMVAGRAAATRPHRGDIVLALVADEEFESAGTMEVLRHVTADGAIVVEPRAWPPTARDPTSAATPSCRRVASSPASATWRSSCRPDPGIRFWARPMCTPLS
jgi:acetylornithine deacetylase